MIGKVINLRNDQVTASVEEIVPKDHFLRTFDETIDFSFINEKIPPYCQGTTSSIFNVVPLWSVYIVISKAISNRRSPKKKGVPSHKRSE